MLYHHGANSPPSESVEKYIFHSSKVQESLLSIHNITTCFYPEVKESSYLLGLNKYSPGDVWIWIYQISFNEGFTESQVNKFMIHGSHALV